MTDDQRIFIALWDRLTVRQALRMVWIKAKFGVALAALDAWLWALKKLEAWAARRAR